jgi:two-component system chemotaxis response regulator CheB
MAIVQDPTTAESKLMPEAAVRAVPRARVMPLAAIVDFLVGLPAGVPEREDA